MERIRILFLADCLKRGGSERQLEALLHFLVKVNEYEIILLLRNNIVEFELPASNNYKTIAPDEKLGKIEYYKFLKQQLHKFKPHIVHSWEKTTATIAGFTKLFTCESFKLIDGTSRFSRPLAKSGSTYWVFQFNHLVADIVVGNSLASLAVHGHKPNKKHRHIPNGIDLVRFSAETSRQSATSIRLVMVANFTRAKDQNLLVIAVSHLLDQGYDLEVLFIGDGLSRETVQKRVSDKYKDRFDFTGKLLEVDPKIQESDIGILLNNPGHAEGMSNAIMEYMTAGLPVICTDAGSNPELVKNNVNGYTVPYSCSESLVKAIVSLVTDSALRKHMGTKSREKAKAIFPMEKMIQSYRSLYESLVR